MGSHIFKVDELCINIDEKFWEKYLDQVCPANGYYDPTKPIPYEPDPNIPEVEPVEGEIILILCDALDAAVALRASSVSSKKIRYSLYGKNDVLISDDEVNNNATYFKELPASGGIELTNGYNAFVLKITGVETNLLAFRQYTYTGYGTNGWPIIEAHIKCPSLTSLAYAFQNQIMFLYAKFYDNHNNLTNMSYFAENASNFKDLQMNVEMNSLTTLLRAFAFTSLENYSLPDSLPALTTLERAFTGSNIVNQSNLPMDLPSLTTMHTAYDNCKKLGGTFFIPNAPNLNIITYLCRNTLITKVKALSGYPINTGIATLAFDGCLFLKEIDLSAGEWGQDSIRWLFNAVTGTLPKLNVLKLPTKIKNLKFTGDSGGNTHDLRNLPALKILTTTVFEYYDSNTIAMNIGGNPLLKVINLPNLRTSLITCNGSSSRTFALESIEIDWENSTGNINFRYTSLPVEEINRIFTALPDITGGTARTIDVRNTPGYATCDKSIAENKGWTVS